MNVKWSEGRAHLAPIVDEMHALLVLVDKQFEQGRKNGDSVDYGRFEEEVMAANSAVERAVHQVVLTSLDVDTPFICMWGKKYRRLTRQAKSYGSMSGPVSVTRTLYRELGQRGGGCLDVVGIRAGVVDDTWLPRAARAMGHLLALGTSRESATTSKELGRLPFSRCSFERAGHAVGREYLKRQKYVEQRLIEVLEMPAETRSISVAVDRVSLPMEEPVEDEVDSETEARIRTLKAAIAAQPR